MSGTFAFRRNPKTFSKEKGKDSYVAGAGRGATGFMTRSDIGPAVPSTSGGRGVNGIASSSSSSRSFRGRTDFGQAPKGYVGGAGRGAGTVGNFGKDTLEHGEKERDYSEANFDKESGFNHALFKETPYGTDDREADAVYEAVDNYMKSRGKRRREAREKEMMKKQRYEKPLVKDQFSDLKQELKHVTAAEWESIPEVGERTHKQQKKETHSFPVPDNIITMTSSSSRQTSHYAQGGFDGMQTPIGGYRAPGVGGATDKGGLTSVLGSQIGGLAEARERILSQKLQKMSDSVHGQTVVDPKGYLTSLNSRKLNTMNEIADIKKGRLLLQSVTKTNPKDPSGWIAFARLEVAAGNMVEARRIMKRGCEECKTSEDVWIERVSLQTPANAKIILAQAVRCIPTSVRIWQHAADLETSTLSKRRVYRKALEHIPKSVRLWKSAVALEDRSDARIMLGRAVECVPQSVDLWLALARLETYDEAKKVLNMARQSIPKEVRIWTAAAQLEEANSSSSSQSENENGKGRMKPEESCRPSRIIELARRSFLAQGVNLNRSKWLAQAEAAEKAGAPRTAVAIVWNCLNASSLEHPSAGKNKKVDGELNGSNVNSNSTNATTLVLSDSEKIRILVGDAESVEKRGQTQVARALLAVAIDDFGDRRRLWHQYIDFERRNGTRDDILATLLLATKRLPECEIFWLMAAKHKWESFNDVDGARDLLTEAFNYKENSEQLWLAKAKLEKESGEVETARTVLFRARKKIQTPRIWMKSALLEWECERLDEEEELLLEALKLFPSKEPKLWMMLGQLWEERGEKKKRKKNKKKRSIDTEEWFLRAKEAYANGVSRFPTCTPLWILSANLEKRTSNIIRARSILERARIKLPKNPEIWMEAIRLELSGDSEETKNPSALLVCKERALKLLSRALQQCPKSGQLWAANIALTNKKQQKTRSADALRNCGSSDPFVVLAVAQLFWCQNPTKVEKARKWFNRAVALGPSLGDAWASFYQFEREQERVSVDEAGHANKIKLRVKEAKPKNGRVWQAISKKRRNRLVSFETIYF